MSFTSSLAVLTFLSCFSLSLILFSNVHTCGTLFSGIIICTFIVVDGIALQSLFWHASLTMAEIYSSSGLKV